jgi:putative sigma-54 modulation protein
MQVNLTGHHIDLTPSLRDYVDEKLQRLKRHFDHMTNVHVVLTVEKLNQKAEAVLHVGGAEIFADCTKDDMYAAIDGMTDKLDRQILKHKEKLSSHRK